MKTLNYNPTPRLRDGDSMEQVLVKINQNFEEVYGGPEYNQGFPKKHWPGL